MSNIWRRCPSWRLSDQSYAFVKRTASDAAPAIADDFFEAASGVSGVLSALLGPVTLAASATIPIQGALSRTLDSLALTATAVLPIQASLSATLEGVTLDATATLPVAIDDPPPVTEVIVMGGRRRRDKAQPRAERSVEDILREALAEHQPAVSAPVEKIDKQEPTAPLSELFAQPAAPPVVVPFAPPTLAAPRPVLRSSASEEDEELVILCAAAMAA